MPLFHFTCLPFRVILRKLKAIQETLMALEDSFNALKVEVADTNAKIDKTVALVQSLKDQIANGGVITAADLDAVTAELSADSDKLPQE